jgi:hypothetical protein
MVYHVLQKVNKPQPTLLAFKKVLDQAFKRVLSPTTVCIQYRKDSNDAREQLVTSKDGYQWQYEPYVGNVTGLVAITEYYTRTTHLGI